MERVDQDWAVRQHAFRFLDQLSATHGDVLPWKALQDGFHFAGRRITLIGQRGIWKPAALDLPISIITSPKDPYGDEADETGLLQYRYYGADPNHPDNMGLRRCFHEGRPLIYLRAVDKGWYTALWPMVLVNDDPGSLTFTGACVLRHGLQALHGARLAVVPRQPDERPDPERLGERYEEFRAAG
jgi:putative restriction endonuclease